MDLPTPTASESQNGDVENAQTRGREVHVNDYPLRSAIWPKTAFRCVVSMCVCTSSCARPCDGTPCCHFLRSNLPRSRDGVGVRRASLGASPAGDGPRCPHYRSPVRLRCAGFRALRVRTTAMMPKRSARRRAGRACASCRSSRPSSRPYC